MVVGGFLDEFIGQCEVDGFGVCVWLVGVVWGLIGYMYEG